MKINKIFLAGIMMLSLVSCSNELDIVPSQQKVDANLIVDQKSAETAINGVYYTYAMCGTDRYDVKSTMCSMYYEILPSDIAGTCTYYQGPYMLETHGSNYYTVYNSYLWKPVYSIINAANNVISQMKDSKDEWFAGNRKNEIIGEAYCMRALVNFQLLVLFGYSWDVNSPYGNILRTEPSNVSTLKTGRSSVADTYNAIISDLDIAIEKAPANGKNCFATSWLAKGLKVRALMQRGQNGDYAEAASLAQDIIQNGPYSLEDNVVDVFHKNGLKSNEVIFGIQPKENQTDVTEQYFYRGNAQWYPSDALNALFENDPRRTAMLPVVETQSIVIIPEPFSYYFVTVEIPVVGKHFANGVFSASTLSETQYNMRLTEIYLLRAEALARTGDLNGAKNILKTVLGHAGYTDFSMVDAATSEHDVMQQIFNEEVRQFFCESGQDAAMMLRFPKDIVCAFNPEYNDITMSIFAIPSDEFRFNAGVSPSDQNPGYSAE